MLRTSVLDEGYDALDVNTNVAIAYVERHRASIDAMRFTERVAQRSPEGTRTLLVVDSACDLPQAWLDQNYVVVIPRVLRLHGKDIREVRGNDLLQQLMHSQRQGDGSAAQSFAAPPVAMRDEMQRHMTPETQSMLFLCSSARRSKVFVSALSATQSLVLIHNKVRKSMGASSSLRAWVIDSTNGFGGVGVLLAHAVMLREQGVLPDSIALTLSGFRRTIHTLIVPNDLSFAARTARSIERQGVSGWKVSIASLLNLKPILHLNADQLMPYTRVRGHVPAVSRVLARLSELVSRGSLDTPFVAVGYSGRLDEIEALEEYKALRTLCSRHRVTLSLAPMSATSVMMLGPRALTASFASRQFTA
jgi:DegV family protein with EDD domain